MQLRESVCVCVTSHVVNISLHHTRPIPCRHSYRLYCIVKCTHSYENGLGKGIGEMSGEWRSLYLFGFFPFLSVADCEKSVKSSCITPHTYRAVLEVISSKGEYHPSSLGIVSGALAWL